MFTLVFFYETSLQTDGSASAQPTWSQLTVLMTSLDFPFPKVLGENIYLFF